MSKAGKETMEATPKKIEKFLATLSVCGNVTRSALEAGLNRTTLYRKRSEDKDFAREWETALEMGNEALEDEARRRAYEGWEEPVWHKGQECGTVRKFSDTLLIVLLKAHKPEKYADRKKVDLNATIANMGDDELRKAIVAMEAQARECGVFDDEI